MRRLALVLAFVGGIPLLGWAAYEFVFAGGPQWTWQERKWNNVMLLVLGALVLILAAAILAYLLTPRDKR